MERQSGLSIRSTKFSAPPVILNHPQLPPADKNGLRFRPSDLQGRTVQEHRQWTPSRSPGRREDAGEAASSGGLSGEQRSRGVDVRAMDREDLSREVSSDATRIDDNILTVSTVASTTPSAKQRANQSKNPSSLQTPIRPSTESSSTTQSSRIDKTNTSNRSWMSRKTSRD